MMHSDDQPTDSPAIALLKDRGAETAKHSGGTLLTHLLRVEALLAAWGARPALQTAALCHAFYGTDGLPLVLLELSERDHLAEAIGTEAEELVYFYASCDRKASYPSLAAPDGAAVTFRDRFTGEEFTPSLQQRRDFAELTVANELDLAKVNESFRERNGAALLDLFTRWSPLLSDAARHEVTAVLGAGGGAAVSP
ncbi:DUF6817 domain-containing protein [Streptomyces sp. NPDC048352]|uniref:DUF6817 domain-containing protein n=1 Tax=Streptomyces sp. NPDC048352 TaxID=3154718 RepID=UPI00343A2504